MARKIVPDIVQPVDVASVTAESTVLDASKIMRDRRIAAVIVVDGNGDLTAIVTERDIVFRGSFYVTLDIGKRLIEEGRRANFLSILTTWVWNGGPFVVPSAMSKAGLNVMTQSLAVEWGRHGLRFNAIAPGLFPTDGMSARLSPGGRGGNSQDDMNPMGRHGEMHELANLAVFLMGPGAEWINGETIAIDGAGYKAHGGSFYGALKDMGDEQWSAMREMIKGTNAQDKSERTT